MQKPRDFKARNRLDIGRFPIFTVKRNSLARCGNHEVTAETLSLGAENAA